MRSGFGNQGRSKKAFSLRGCGRGLRFLYKMLLLHQNSLEACSDGVMDVGSCSTSS